MAGNLNLFDSTHYTSSSEYGSRQGEQIRYLQIHHATLLNLLTLIMMMMPGGRQVSANGALGNDGHLVEVVPLWYRAFTSATGFDRRSFTVETCNLSLAPGWKISHASRERLARLAVDLYRRGLLGGLTREFIIGHNEVPGTYATACPGPDMDLDWIVWRAQQIHGSIPAGTPGLIIVEPTYTEEDKDMLFYTTEDDKRNGKVASYFLAGVGNGEAAWLPISDQTLANEIAADCRSQKAKFLTKGTAASWGPKFVKGERIAA